MKIDKEKSITYSKYWSHSNPNQDRNRINLYSVLKKIQNFLNRYILNKLGLEVRKKQSSMRKEQISYINNTEILSLRNEQIANFLVEFGVINNIPFDKGKILKNIELFDEIFKKNKITDLNGGLGYNNGLFLFLTFSHFQPQLIIESGIWRGFTTYLIDKATSENSKIFTGYMDTLCYY
jgi:hypothetical protein